jgi:hypothetical protein
MTLTIIGNFSYWSVYESRTLSPTKPECKFLNSDFHQIFYISKKNRE